ncbi:MAG: aminopeptidase N [Gammaproteobacteria bacterium]|uniref:aminopeptidase N n=1 Tax=Rhodoferax sp. TaxID=50421 RepID=UPI0018475E3D|nr:aminopeptidase N [Rhodoferax sp.]MBU3898918.1 aminopeptidase N [Gammaproteobacteria bacterium]MBA3059265.1 aminopeptidase N [Rhodoferax sp.]MBU3996010.1 aminopeptidase N [Gammaproteobacteria bacterium]MBU4018361.1 aminopeptidase N [Gammaproteobacteria bacterium]MBU4080374.1 aminopeptidase N [Gammaproteobacteria bacterium]
MLQLRDSNGPATVIRRADYSAPAFWIDSVHLSFDLDPAKTRVLNKMTLRRNPDVPVQPLRLDGETLNLARVLVNGQGTSFKFEGGKLVLENLPLEGAFELEIFTTCEPLKNTSLSGLYVSNDSFFTQCEAEGFRRITYFLDRPDVMASYTVTLRADKQKYPVLLSNGNLVASGALEGTGNERRHFATWVDPHKKPCYLFALVAGQLVCREQRITSRAGKEHLLQVYVRPGDMDKTEHAMNSLMASVVWDEARFGLPLDLERFMIVATSDFNMGAMENKGLNVFNSKYVLASQATATDADFSNIESVVGHEYFHNWTGNRITCRDWFQLSLKEGLTVFRDQEFSMDLCAEPSARAVKRIEDVRVLRTAQFPEDAGPMAHPVRPDSYIEINNFYTVTIYEKGAEVVRMMQTLVGSLNDPTGRAGFAKGVTLYFERHDGQAVTCDDFAQAIADANPDSALSKLLPQFKRWYSQAGTPRLQAKGNYDATAQTYTLNFNQSCPATPGQDNKEPFVIPVSLGLVGASGASLTLQLQGDSTAASSSHLLVLTQAQESITFVNVAEEPVPSILRGFSAPVLLDFDYSDAELLTLLAFDPDPFNRWEAGQRLALRSAVQAIASDFHLTGARPLNDQYVGAMRAVLRHPALDASFKELVLTLPSETYIAEQLDVVDPQRIHAVREAMRAQLASALAPDWQWAFETHANNGAYRPDAVSAGRRALTGLALTQLCLAARDSGDNLWPGKAYQRFKDADNMTDRFNALNALVNSGHELAKPALAQFHSLFKNEELVLDKWFALQAGSCDRGGQVLPAVRQLLRHPDFNLRNPNRARSVIFSYCSANPGAFHRLDAAGYAFWSERVLELDSINPQVAARLARALDRWSKLAEPYRSAARQAIERVADKLELSNDVREVVSRALAD